MHLLTLQPTSTTDAYVRGDVVIHPSAAIAPGVLLQADAGSQIFVGPGVCIGMGSVLHAIAGKLEVGSGANLGAGVLLIGTCKIGENACIGAASTIMNAAIANGLVVPPGSLIGEFSQQAELSASVTPDTSLGTGVETSVSQVLQETVVSAKQIEEVTISRRSEATFTTPDISANVPVTPNTYIHPTPYTPPNIPPVTPYTPPEVTPNIAQGKAHLNKLMGKIFPNGQDLNHIPNLNPDGSNSPG